MDGKRGMTGWYLTREVDGGGQRCLPSRSAALSWLAETWSYFLLPFVRPCAAVRKMGPTSRPLPRVKHDIAEPTVMAPFSSPESSLHRDMWWKSSLLNMVSLLGLPEIDFNAWLKGPCGKKQSLLFHRPLVYLQVLAGTARGIWWPWGEEIWEILT